MGHEPRRLLVLFAGEKNIPGRPQATSSPRGDNPPSPPQWAISSADPQALGSAGGPDDFILARVGSADGHLASPCSDIGFAVTGSVRATARVPAIAGSLVPRRDALLMIFL